MLPLHSFLFFSSQSHCKKTKTSRSKTEAIKKLSADVFMSRSWSWSWIIFYSSGLGEWGRGSYSKEKFPARVTYRPVTNVTQINYRLLLHVISISAHRSHRHILFQSFLLMSSKVKLLVEGNVISEGGAGLVDHLLPLSAMSACHVSHAPPAHFGLSGLLLQLLNTSAHSCPPSAEQRGKAPSDQLRGLLQCLLESTQVSCDRTPEDNYKSIQHYVRKIVEPADGTKYQPACQEELKLPSVGNLRNEKHQGAAARLNFTSFLLMSDEKLGCFFFSAKEGVW